MADDKNGAAQNNGIGKMTTATVSAGLRFLWDFYGVFRFWLMNIFTVEKICNIILLKFSIDTLSLVIINSGVCLFVILFSCYDAV